MCDVQLLIGIGILLSGYISLSCFISAYHWQLVVYLAWFSHLTHIACLTSLRRYFHYHQLERNWRLLLMTVLWASLILAMVPTTFFNWLYHMEQTASLPSSSASCFFNFNVGHALLDDSGCFRYRIDSSDIMDSYLSHPLCRPLSFAKTSAFQSTIVSILLLGFSFFSRAIKLTKSLSDSVRVTIRQRTSDCYIKKLAKRINKTATNPQLSNITARCVHFVHVKLRIALYLECKMYADLLVSDASDVSFHNWFLVTKLDVSRKLLTSSIIYM